MIGHRPQIWSNRFKRVRTNAAHAAEVIDIGERAIVLPRLDNLFGQLAAMRVIPVVVLDNSAAAAPLVGALADAGQAEHAVEAGARFIVSPGFDEEAVRRRQELSVPVLPGAATATEIQRARRAELRDVKYVPAETLDCSCLTASRCDTSKRATAPVRN